MSRADGDVVIRARHSLSGFGVALVAAAVDPSGRPTHFATDVTFKENTDSGSMVSPTFMLKDEAAQLLMDELWALGLRPSNVPNDVSALAQAKEHLADMRRLVFDPPRQHQIDPIVLRHLEGLFQQQSAGGET